MYTLRVHQADLPKRTIFLDKTKNGDKRQVPTSSVARGLLEAYVAERKLAPDALLFPWWSGEDAALSATSDFLSKSCSPTCSSRRALHDLQREAPSRLFERTQLSETQIMKITGHNSQRMMMRYANLRGSDLAAGLW
nr:tyrosine-type recombinase/integrase [Achromobacter sp. UMC71]